MAEEINLKFNWLTEFYKILSLYEVQVSLKTVMWDDLCNGRANPGFPLLCMFNCKDWTPVIASNAG